MISRASIAVDLVAIFCLVSVLVAIVRALFGDSDQQGR
jgi:hypothetical protein